MLVDADKRLDEIPFKCMIVILDDQEKMTRAIVVIDGILVSSFVLTLFLSLASLGVGKILEE